MSISPPEMKTRSSGSGSSSRCQSAVSELLKRLASAAGICPDSLSDYVSESQKKRKEEKPAVSELVMRLASAADISPDSLSDYVSESQKKRKEEKVYRPSDLVYRKNWKGLQFRDLGQCSDAPRFICYRGPPETTPRVPLVLLHKSFMEFCSNAEAFSELNEVDMKAAFQLWKLCSEGWDDEVNLCSEGWDDEVHSMSRQLSHFFTTYLESVVRPTGCMDGATGSMDGKVDSVMVVFEYKTEPADAWFEGLEYLRRWFLSSKRIPRRPSHALLVLVTCPYIQVVAVVMDWGKEKLLAEPLTAHENCFGPVYNARRVAGLLRALKVFSSSYDSERTIDCRTPFPFRDKVTQQLGGKFVYLLGKDRVGKITRHYGEEAHRSWEEQGVAPPLLGVKTIGNGWSQVEMSFLGIEDGWCAAEEVVSKCKEHPSSLENLINSIRAAVQKGHSTGYVHGDLRLPNMKVREVDGLFHVMFVDFGWAGRIDEATYPSLLNPELGWHPEAQFGKKIAVAHDLHFVDKLVEQLENLYTSSGAVSHQVADLVNGLIFKYDDCEVFL